MGYNFRHWYIPETTMGGIERYIKYGLHPGSFLTSIITNDFKGACANADDENLANLPAYAAYFYNEVPCGAWGSKEEMKAWMESKRAENITNK